MEIQHGGKRRINKYHKKKSEMAVFTKAKELINFSYNVTENWPKKYRYDFTARVRNTALDIYEKLIEANEVYVEDKKTRKVGEGQKLLILLGEMLRASEITKRRGLQNKAFAGLKMLNYLFSEAYARRLINIKKWSRAAELISDVMGLLKAWAASDRRRYSF